MSQPFHQQTWNNRYQAMGDEAEGIFEQTHKLNWVRTGLNRPPLQMSQLSLAVRYMPDYLTSRCWVEVQGCGRDKVVRIKAEKIEALLEWSSLDHPVEFFFWDTTNKRHCQVPLADVVRAVRELEQNLYPEGKVFFEIPTDLFEWEPYVPSQEEPQ